MPWGDGIVDAADLEVLMRYWGQEILAPEVIGHWKLDESEGTSAHDSAGGHHATLFNGPAWHPEGGQSGGALEFDGIDDLAATEAILNPSTGPFSIFVWVKGGIPGQVILSQENGANWLMADPATGALRTELRVPEVRGGRTTTPAGPPLVCTTVITDGNWHRVGFVRTATIRVLYVDDVEAACDTAVDLESATGGLYLSAGSTLASGSFWSGLIDDVRIYHGWSSRGGGGILPTREWRCEHVDADTEN
jgi:hypothetical protein